MPLYACGTGGRIVRLDDAPAGPTDPVTAEFVAVGLNRAPLVRGPGESDGDFERRQIETARRLRDRFVRLLRSRYYWESDEHEQRRLLEEAATAVLGDSGG
jgi:hypothetical protein